MHFLEQVFKAPEFTNDEIDTVVSKFKQVQFAKNEYLIREGNTANHYWFVESGYVRSYAIDTAGNDISTGFYSISEIVIDWPSFFMRTPTRENMIAMTDCVCWQLDFETFQQLFHSIVSFREAGRSRLVSSYFQLKQHNISMIADEAKVRYMRLITEKPEIIQNVSLKHIASYLGVTDTSLSRIRKELSK